MTAPSVRAAGRFGALATSLLSFAVACAQVTQGDVVGDGLTQGGTGDDAGTAGTGATAGDSAISGSGGTGTVPVAGSTTGGGGVATAGSNAGGMAGGGMGGMGGMGGAGGMSGGGMGGSGGTSAGTGGGGGGGAGSTGHRYVRVVAKSEQRADRVWSSCAELGLLTTGGTALPRTGWKIAADSEETDDEQVPATNAIDGDINTFWHTEWEPAPDDVNDDPLPHQLVIDLGSAKVITGFTYTPRQSGENGRIKDWEFYVSNTNGTWGTAVDSGSFPAGTATQSITF